MKNFPLLTLFNAPLQTFFRTTLSAFYEHINEDWKENYKKERKDKKVVTIVAKILVLENPGNDPGTSRIQSGRSTIWANSPKHMPLWKLMSEITAIE